MQEISTSYTFSTDSNFNRHIDPFLRCMQQSLHHILEISPSSSMIKLDTLEKLSINVLSTLYRYECKAVKKIKISTCNLGHLKYIVIYPEYQSMRINILVHDICWTWNMSAFNRFDMLSIIAETIVNGAISYWNHAEYCNRVLQLHILI